MISKSIYMNKKQLQNSLFSRNAQPCIILGGLGAGEIPGVYNLEFECQTTEHEVPQSISIFNPGKNPLMLTDTSFIDSLENTFT